MILTIRLLFAFLFIAIFIAIVVTLTLASKNKALIKASNELTKALNKNELKRNKEQLENVLMEGENDNQNIFYKLDVLIIQSGLKKKLPFLNSETFLIFTIIIGLATSIFLQHIIGIYIISIISFLFVCAFGYMIIYIIAGRKFIQTEQCIMQFVNLLDNYSKTSDDIIDIFGKISYYLDEPLRTAIIECHTEATNTGDISTSFRNLSTKIEHPKFKEIIRNLEICRKHEANYSTIIKDIRYNLKEYLKSKEERKAEEQTARISMAIMVVFGVIILTIINGFVTEGTVITVLMSSIIGQCIILYFIILLLVVLFNIIKVDKK